MDNKEIVKIIEDPDGYSVKVVYRDNEYFEAEDPEGLDVFEWDYLAREDETYDLFQDFKQRLP